MPVRRHVGILQFTEDGDGMDGELDALGRIAHLTAKPGALSGGDLTDIRRAFQEKHVGLAGFRQRVRHATADGATADDDDFGAGEWVHHASHCNVFKYHLTKLATLYSLKVE